MATQDDIIKLIMQVQGRQELSELEAAQLHEVETLRIVDAALKANHITQQQYDDQLAKTKVATEALIDGQSRLGTASARAGSAAARGILEFSRGVEDFVTGGPIGILNNIPGMAYSAGQAFKLSAQTVAAATAGISLAATGLFLLWRNSDKIADYLGLDARAADTFADRLKALNERVKELTDKPHKVSVDYHNLDDAARQARELKEQLQAAENLRHERTELQGKTAKAAKEAVVEKGGGLDNVVAALLDVDKRTGEFSKSDTREEGARAKDREAAGYRADAARQSDPAMKGAAEHYAQIRAKEAAEIRAEIAKDLPKRIEALITDATSKGEAAALARLQGLLSDNPADFSRHGIGHEFGAGLRKADPKRIKRDEDDAQFREDQEDKLALEKSADDAHDKAENKARAELTHQGAQNEKELRGRVGNQLFETQAQREAREGREKAHADREAATAHDKDVREAVSDFGPGLVQGATIALAEGMSADKARAAIRDRLDKSGVGAAIIDEVTAELFKNADVAVKRKVNEAGGDVAAGHAAAIREGGHREQGRERAGIVQGEAEFLQGHFPDAPRAQVDRVARRGVALHLDEGVADPDAARAMALQEEQERGARTQQRFRGNTPASVVRKGRGFRSVPAEDPDVPFGQAPMQAPDHSGRVARNQEVMVGNQAQLAAQAQQVGQYLDRVGRMAQQVGQQIHTQRRKAQ